MFKTRDESPKKPVASPPRCLPAWSGVQDARRRDRDAGLEHGSTLTSSVVAEDVAGDVWF
jgi:hypothetical protein